MLLTEDEFGAYIRATGVSELPVNAYSADMELWEKYFDLPNRFQKLEPSIQFLTSGYWMCRSEADACRKTISEAMRVRPEIDPSKPDHIAVIADYIALFLHSLSKVIARVFSTYLHPDSREQLSDALLVLLYGGRDRYSHLNELRRIISATQSGVAADRPLTLPAWDKFLQLVRSCLDAPVDVPYSALLVREIAWGYLAGKHDLTFAKQLARENRQAAKLAVMGCDYLLSAAKLPPEVGEIIQNDLLEVQALPASV
jgi:hypothetical protein